VVVDVLTAFSLSIRSKGTLSAAASVAIVATAWNIVTMLIFILVDFQIFVRVKLLECE
jgi:hypothetical protein